MLATTIQITNNPPHTTHTNNNNCWPAAQAPTTQQRGGRRSHGVEREPDSVLIHHNVYAQPKNAPTPTTHIRWRTHAGTRKQTNTTTTVTQLAPHKTGLPRKEVIQPHLPVRLPCYDFVPIANPTFDHSPHKRG